MKRSLNVYCGCLCHIAAFCILFAASIAAQATAVATGSTTFYGLTIGSNIGEVKPSAVDAIWAYAVSATANNSLGQVDSHNEMGNLPSASGMTKASVIWASSDASAVWGSPSPVSHASFNIDIPGKTEGSATANSIAIIKRNFQVETLFDEPVIAQITGVTDFHGTLFTDKYGLFAGFTVDIFVDILLGDTLIAGDNFSWEDAIGPSTGLIDYSGGKGFNFPAFLQSNTDYTLRITADTWGTVENIPETPTLALFGIGLLMLFLGKNKPCSVRTALSCAPIKEPNPALHPTRALRLLMCFVGSVPGAGG